MVVVVVVVVIILIRKLAWSKDDIKAEIIAYFSLTPVVGILIQVIA